MNRTKFSTFCLEDPPGKTLISLEAIFGFPDLKGEGDVIWKWGLPGCDLPIF